MSPTAVKLQRLLETQQRANVLLAEHGLAQQGWRFEFSNRKRAVGTCFHGRKLIVVSKYYIESHPDEIVQGCWR